jgi:proteasome accessory factor A
MAVKKVMGTEVEYGITVVNDKDFDPISSCVLLVNAYRDHSDAKILWDYDQENPLADARGFQADGEKYTPNQQENITRNKTLVNGARYYVDHAHPEYSTPECSNVLDLVKHEKAGEVILERSRLEANELVPAPCRILVYKNNSDRKGNSYGCHENFLMDRKTSFKQIIEKFIPFLVTRQIYTGSGKVGSENRVSPVNYQISQRADFFETEVALDTMVKRPIINTRDEPHADREKYRRLHVIVADSNMAEPTIYLKSGVTAIILSMIEEGVIETDLVLRDPVKSIKEVSHNVTCKAKIQLDNGKKMTAIEMQEEYLALAHKYYATRHADEVTKDVMTRWESVLRRLKEDPAQLCREIDWVIKRELILAFMNRKNYGWDNPRVGLIDLQYHDIRPQKGLYHLLLRQGKVERIVTDEEIADAVVNPPIDTRAYFRGMCLRKYASSIFGVNWDSISFNLEEQPIKRILMAEPLKGTKEHVDGLLEQSGTTEELVANLTAES